MERNRNAIRIEVTGTTYTYKEPAAAREAAANLRRVAAKRREQADRECALADRLDSEADDLAEYREQKKLAKSA